VSSELNSDMIALIEDVAGGIEEPAMKVASAIRCYLHLARSHRLLARFLAGAGLHLAGAGHEARQRSGVYDFLPADIEAGQACGDFSVVSVDVAVDVVKGAMLVAIDRMAHGRIAKDYPEKVATLILRALGVPADKAERLIAPTLPKMTPAADSLLARVQLRAAARAPAEA